MFVDMACYILNHDADKTRPRRYAALQFRRVGMLENSERSRVVKVNENFFRKVIDNATP